MPPDLCFEIKKKDLAGRIGSLVINGRKLETPALMPVYNPNKPIIPIEEMQDRFGLKVLMTNSYILLKNEELKEKVLEEGLHSFLDFDGIIATDSGSFQLMAYGSVSTTNKEIIDFQGDIGSDIGSFLDIPSLPDLYKPRAEEELKTTLQRAKEATSARFIVNAGVQGSTHLDLRKKAAEELGKDFELCAVGGIVRLMEDYRFRDLVDVIATVKKNLPTSRVVHAFGLGHPMVFSLAAALGCDLFDSAAYALYAQDDRYMTPFGTKRLASLEYLPCSCPICSKHGLGLKELAGEERIKSLALHNLYVSFEELSRVKQAICEGSLWELLACRLRTHPQLLSALEGLRTYGGWLSELDMITKGKPVYYTGPETAYRPEVLNAQHRLARVSSENRVGMEPFGEVPAEILELYPFGSFASPESAEQEKSLYKVSDLEKIRAMMDYQFGAGAGELIEKNVRIKKSRKTRRIRWVYQGKELIASVRASDHFILPKRALAEKLLEKFKYPLLRVVIEDDEAASFVEGGKSVFAKFASDIDPELRAGDEVLVVGKDDRLLRIGTLVLSPREVKDFKRGVAVRVR